jgi:carbamate kinase
VYLDWGKPEQRPLRQTTPAELKQYQFAAGSMGPKVDAACDFVEATGQRAAIGALEDIEKIVAGQAGTNITPEGGVRERADARAAAGQSTDGEML